MTHDFFITDTHAIFVEGSLYMAPEVCTTRRPSIRSFIHSSIHLFIHSFIWLRPKRIAPPQSNSPTRRLSHAQDLVKGLSHTAFRFDPNKPTRIGIIPLDAADASVRLVGPTC